MGDGARSLEDSHQRHGHRRADARNLHLHRAAIAKLRVDPTLRQRCLALVERWLATPDLRSSSRWLEQWRAMLGNWPLDRIAALVLDETEGQTLRQCSPLGPALTPRERWSLLREINARLGPIQRTRP
jgi:hypothetical protein